MATIDDDSFLDEFHTLVERAHAEHLAHVERVNAARLAREERGHELLRHITRRFSAVASWSHGSGQAIEYLTGDAGEDVDLPITHTLHWRLTRPHRKLEATVSVRTGRYWFRVTSAEADAVPHQLLHDTQGDDVMNVTTDDVDQFIRCLADQHAWQHDEPLARLDNLASRELCARLA